MGTDSIARKTDSRKSDKPRYHVDPEGYGVTEEIENGIRRQAWKIGSEHRNYSEIDDLAQEGRIAAWKEATLHEPRTDYCLHRSKQAMAQCARSGRSVESRMWHTYRRKKRYFLKEFDAPLSPGQAPKDATLADIMPDSRPYTENQAFSHIALDDVEDLLTDEELEVARLKAAGFDYKEMVGLGLFDRWDLEEHSRNIRKKLAWYFGRDDLLPKPRIRKTGARFKWQPPSIDVEG